MEAWLNLRRFIDLTTDDTEFGQLDSISQRVLEWLCARFNSKSSLFVQSIVLDSKIASPATIHKCLATLDRTGFLSFKVDPEDARRRIVSPTAKASKTLDALSRRVAKWARQQRALRHKKGAPEEPLTSECRFNRHPTLKPYLGFC